MPGQHNGATLMDVARCVALAHLRLASKSFSDSEEIRLNPPGHPPTLPSRSFANVLSDSIGHASAGLELLREWEAKAGIGSAGPREEPAPQITSSIGDGSGLPVLRGFSEPLPYLDLKQNLLDILLVKMD